jgi:hypothetical protein
VDDLLGVAKSKRIDSVPSDWNWELTSAIMVDFLFRNWCATFGVMSKPIENLLLTMLINSTMLSSILGRLRPCLSVSFKGIHGQSNGITNALINIGIFCFLSAGS